jgi:hypothetical protein
MSLPLTAQVNGTDVISKRRVDAPKPNTRFLNNLLRETDSHNAALRRKEENSSRETLGRHRRTKSDKGRDKRNEELLDYRDEHRSRSHRSSRNYATDSDTDHHKSLSRKHRHRHSDERRHSRYQRERSRSPNRSARYDESRDRHHRRWNRHSSYRSLSRSPPRPSSPSTLSHRKIPRDDKSLKRRHFHGVTRTSSPHSHRLLESRNELKEAVTEEESDPLEDLLGPLPPPPNDVYDSTLIRSRGRGAYRINRSNIDSHFATDYNPALDIHLDGENTAPSTRLSRRPVAGLMTEDNNDWDMALEALRDRALWKENSADRLRAAGFTEQVVDRFVDNLVSAGSTRSEKDGRMGDFKWSKKGESREWDRGKVMDQDGHFDVKAPW